MKLLNTYIFFGTLLFTSLCIGGTQQQTNIEVNKKSIRDTSCIKTACKYLGGCSFESDLKNVISACKKSNGSCLQISCKYAGDCHFSSSLFDLIHACINSDASCIEAVCDQSSATCYFDSSLYDAINSCK